MLNLRYDTKNSKQNLFLYNFYTTSHCVCVTNDLVYQQFLKIEFNSRFYNAYLNHYIHQIVIKIKINLAFITIFNKNAEMSQRIATKY